jgi:DNA helicase-2/ATP-dependent DNA helicase PcrA
MRKIRLQKSASDRLREAFTRDLNEAQREAATAAEGFNLILAGPGSGKTRVITYRVAYLIARGVPAESILLVTFTRRAAREMVGRLEGLIGPQATKVWAGTFHHIGNRVLRRHAAVLGYTSNFTILDSEDQQDLVQLALQDAGLTGTGQYAPKASLVLNLISYAFNVGRPLAEVIAERSPELATWTEAIEAAAAAYARRKRSANSLDYDDLLGQWSRLIAEHPEIRAQQGRMFREILVDEMQDTNRVQIELVEAIARAGPGNLTAVGDDAQSIYRFRGANYDNILKFPERNPGARLFRLEVNYRSTPEIVAFTNASIAHNQTGFPKTLVSARQSGSRPVVVPTADAYEEADLICQQILDARDEGLTLGQMAVLYRNHHDSILLQGELVNRGIPYTVRSGLRFFEQAHIKDVLAYLRVVVNPRDEPAWRRLLLLVPGIGPVKAAAVVAHLGGQPDPLAAVMTAGTMALVPAKSKGPFAAFVADLRAILGTGPLDNPAAAVGAVLQGGYPQVLRSRKDLGGSPENRLADIEQLGVLAARYDSLEKLIADLLLAGDVYGMESLDSQEPAEMLVLSTIHQAKGLEWSRVFIPRLIEEGFPSVRSLLEPGGEDEERRIFYVAITRAMDELTLTYPLTIARPGRGATVIATPSRFLNEIDPALCEQAVVETDVDLAWTSGIRPEGDRPGPGGSPTTR